MGKDSFEDGEFTVIPRDVSGLEFAQLALSRWSAFPEGDPRPFVLIHGPILVTAGFATAEAKSALDFGQVSANDSVADEPVRTIRANGADPTGHQLPSHDLEVVSATLSQTSFLTDRGPALLSAWELEACDARGPIWVLDDRTLARCWTTPLAPEGEPRGSKVLNSATIDRDDRVLTVIFTGSPKGFFDYEAAILESDAAVTVLPLGHQIVELRDGTAYGPVGVHRRISATLSRPLGNRVLVNNDGSPVPVTRGVD